MILQVSPESSAFVRGAAACVLALHISGGGMALLSGGAALASRKGGRLHRLAGNIFFVSMLVMSAIGAVVSPFLRPPQWGSVVAGVFTFYLVATAWATVRRRDVGLFEIGAFVVASGVVVGGAVLAVRAMGDPAFARGTQPGVTFVFAAVAALAAVGDLRMIVRGRVLGTRRIARHLWRMCLALFIAAGSLFLGQPKVFPPSLRGSPILFVPEIAVLLAMVFWLIRVRLTRRGARLVTQV
jgi:hypothetical protein